MLPGIKQFDLTGRVAIVTGGSKGLGEAMAAGLASAGADLVLASRHAAEAEATAARHRRRVRPPSPRRRRRRHHAAAGAAMVDRTLAEFGRIDILINNAGINIRGPIDELTYEQFRRSSRSTSTAMWLCCKAVVPHMRQRGCGRIINHGEHARRGRAGQPHALHRQQRGRRANDRALGLELAPYNITCNAICPGPFLTPMNVPIADSEEAKKFIVGAVALNRWGRMEEIQGAAIFLASDASSYMTGSLLTVDGGWTAR